MTPEQAATLRSLPQELREARQWCVAGPDRAPYVVTSSNTVISASIHKRDQWKTFEEALADALLLDGASVGFMITYEDPWTCVDLDVKNEATQRRKGEPIDEAKWTCQAELERYGKIVETFNSYTELSSGGYGVHVWCRGRIGAGARRDGVEVYSQERFMVCTGNSIFPGRKIEERQELLELLVYEIRRQGSDIRAELEELEEEVDDAELFDIACNAANKEKFDALCAGKWREMGFPSQSEADLALMSMLTFYSKSNEQCRRIFRCTALGQREKATKNDRYLNFTLEVIRGRQKREALVTESSAAMAASLVQDMIGGAACSQADIQAGQLAVAQSRPPEVDGSISWPPGMAGALAAFIYGSAPRPVKEVAIVSALGFLAGVCGKAFNIEQSGLNAYLILVARSGVGKEAMHSGISLVLEQLRNSIPSSAKFVDFQDYVSGPALRKAVSMNPCFVNVSGEWGRKLKRLAQEDKADGPMATLRTAMTDLYQKSGSSSIVGGMSYSDKEKNVASVAGVSYSMIGETTPGTFYDALTQTMMEDGFLSRFTVIDYNGMRPPSNQTPVTTMNPSLAQAVHGLCAQALNLISRFASQRVVFSPEAEALLKQFDEECDVEINSSLDETKRQMWNRAHLKVLRFSALLAVADDCLNPTVSLAHAQWALELIRKDIAVMNNKLLSGDVGTDDVTRDRKLLSVLREYVKDGPRSDAYGCPESLIKANIVPKRFLSIRLSQVACFRNTRNGATVALEHSIKSLMDGGYLSEVDKLTLVEKHSYHGRCFRVVSLPPTK